MSELAKGVCTHYWLIDSDDIGICKYCGEKKDFRRLLMQAILKKTPREQTHRKVMQPGSKAKRVNNPYGRRGKPKGG